MYIRIGRVVLTGTLLLLATPDLPAQGAQGAVSATFTLPQCIAYALENHPLVKQSELGEQITAKNIALSLSGWLPQVDVNSSLQHYLQQPATFIPDPANPGGAEVQAKSGFVNISDASLSVSQDIYKTEFIFAGRSIRDLKTLAAQSTESARINTVVNVSKAFWDVLLSEEQAGVIREDIQRLQRNYEDAYHLYTNGLTDKIDYKQASISLNNAKAQESSLKELIRTRYELLKQSMGYPPDQQLQVSYDSAALVSEIQADTSLLPDYSGRIEYRSLETSLRLQHEQTGYYRWSFLPELSAFYDYRLVYQNDQFSSLYHTSYPNSVAGLTLTLPLFHGTERLQNLRRSDLIYRQMKLGEDLLRNQISGEFYQALGSYKSNLYNLAAARENIFLAREVFSTVKLQYNEGIKTYLDLIVADSDLKTAQLNFLSALYQVLSSKLDLQKARGTITP